MTQVKGFPPRGSGVMVLRRFESSDSEDQLHSFAAQIRYYKDYERRNPQYKLVDIYADMYNRILIQCPPHRSVEKWLKQRLSADLNYLPKAFFFVS